MNALPPGVATEFQKLLDRKEIAAYRIVAVVRVTLDFWEAQDYEHARLSLERARREFEEAESAIYKFYQQHAPKISKGELPSHGNRNVA